MATRAKTLSARAMNQAARAARRDEIQARWDQRFLIDSIGRNREEFEKKNDPDFTSWLIYADQKTDLDPLTLLSAISLPTERLHGLVAYLIRVIELKEMSYDEYLQTEEWKGRAERTKNRYENRCALDYAHPADDAHHRTYERRGRERTGDLIALCRACHTKHHGRGG